MKLNSSLHRRATGCSPQREQKSSDCWACGEIGRGLAGQAQQGQVQEMVSQQPPPPGSLVIPPKTKQGPSCGSGYFLPSPPRSEALLFCLLGWLQLSTVSLFRRPRRQRLSTWLHQELGEDAHPCPLTIRLQSWTRKCRSSGDGTSPTRLMGLSPLPRKGWLGRWRRRHL